MRVIDVDSHFLEPADWLAQVNPKLAAELPPPDVNERVVQAAVGDLLEVIPRSQRPSNILELMAPTGRKSFEALLERSKTQGMSALAAPPAGYNADARIAAMDANGIDVQLLNVTLGIGPYVAAQSIKRPDLALKALASFNSWAAGVVAGHTDRLIPVTLLELTDVEWAVKELTRMRAAGSRAFQLRPAPVTPEKSLTHPDYDRVWAAASDLGMAAVIHIGAAKSSLAHGWYFNGGQTSNYSMLHFLAGQMTPQIALAAMLLDGLFERFPKLTVLVQELGIGWVPNFIEVMDSVTVGPYGDQFGIGRANYTLPLTPSEYIRRQVRFTPLVSADRLQPTFDLVPPEVIVFSSDFPHVEGRIEAIQIFDDQLQGVSDFRRELFYGKSMSDLMGI